MLRPILILGAGSVNQASAPRRQVHHKQFNGLRRRLPVKTFNDDHSSHARRARLRRTLFASCLAIEARAEDASPWQRDGHSAVRLLAGSRSGAVLLGGVAFQLQPGWKTYWRTPGDSGVPPRFDFSKSENIEAVTVLWPAPMKFDDGAGGHSLGYRDQVVLPLRIVREKCRQAGDAPRRDQLRGV